MLISRRQEYTSDSSRRDIVCMNELVTFFDLLGESQRRAGGLHPDRRISVIAFFSLRVLAPLHR